MCNFVRLLTSMTTVYPTQRLDANPRGEVLPQELTGTTLREPAKGTYSES
jgi:hypothetical protein